MTEDIKSIKTPHNVIMENRSKVMITGVRDVDTFDDQTIVLVTDSGELTIRGARLHISRFNVETGEIAMDGEIIALVYTNDKPQSGGLLGRLFK